jgi:multiple sugar transport system substrate-binding protein
VFIYQELIGGKKSMFKRLNLLFSFVLIASVLLASCAPAASPADTVVEPQAVEAPVVEVKDFVTWYQFDQENTDPASDERAGNEYVRKTIPMFNEEFKGKWNWVNVFKAFDKVGPELTAAVIAGGEVPDLVATARNLTYAQNGVLQDLSAWASQQSWYADLDPSAVAACTIDGKLLCIPIAEYPNVTYVWADRFPNGYPKTPEEFMVEAERLKNEDKYALTFFGSTAFNGNGFGRAYWDITKSFGGTYDDGKGNLYLSSPENVAAITFMREIVAKDYVPEVAFAGGFQEEEAFKDSSAGAIPTGLFGYRYMNPLTAPDGTQYAKASADDMIDAIEAGDVFLAPSFAPTGKTPGCNVGVGGFGIPTGAKNVEAAYDYINWIMGNIDNNAEYVVLGGGFPSVKSVLNHSSFQSTFYKQAAQAVVGSACAPAEGSLQRPEDAAVIVTNVYYKLIKEDPTADILTELKKAEEEYNKNN